MPRVIVQLIGLILVFFGFVGTGSKTWDKYTSAEIAMTVLYTLSGVLLVAVATISGDEDE